MEDLGKRICIIGPSSSGKSTLAARLGEILSLPIAHLDTFAHKPNTAWERTALPDFIANHDKAIAGDAWIVEGNYSAAMPQRFAKADTVIWCDVPLAGCIWRYLKRCAEKEESRPGQLDGALREFSFGLIKHTLVQYPKNKKKYKKSSRAIRT